MLGQNLSLENIKIDGNVPYPYSSPFSEKNQMKKLDVPSCAPKIRFIVRHEHQYLNYDTIFILEGNRNNLCKYGNIFTCINGWLSKFDSTEICLRIIEDIRLYLLEQIFKVDCIHSPISRCIQIFLHMCDSHFQHHLMQTLYNI